LVDSGGSYLDGTTDITRVFCFGEPTEEQKHDYTAVLKGHIALATVKFPYGTSGHQLDAIAHAQLWNEGKPRKGDRKGLAVIAWRMRSRVSKEHCQTTGRRGIS